LISALGNGGGVNKKGLSDVTAMNKYFSRNKGGPQRNFHSLRPTLRQGVKTGQQPGVGNRIPEMKFA